MSYLDELNEIQRQAVEHIEGPLMIIAGPGSGKTRVLTYRIAHLMEMGVDPYNILSLTFTNKAAREMKNRIEKISGPEARSLYVGTFHSVFARLLRLYAPKLGYPSNFSIYDTQDARSLIKNIIKELGLNDNIYKANIVSNRISNAKNHLLSPKKYAANLEMITEDELSSRPKIKTIYKHYARRCFQAGAMDFDDLLMKMYELISEHADILYKLQHQFKFIMIDEFQDTNEAQYMIVRKLADVHRNIGVVGDDAQSIYGFRGATIQNILNFEKEYENLKVYKLEQNYRSTKNIVNIANEIIKKNTGQLEKTIWTDNGEGIKTKVFKTASDNEEAKRVANNLQEEQLRNHFKNEDFAILYRTNAQSRAMEDALRTRNVPYVVYGGMSFYQRKEIKDLLAYMKVIVNPKDEESLRRVINFPTRGIGNTTMQKVTIVANQNEISIWEVLKSLSFYGFNARITNAVDGFITLIESYQTSLGKKDAFQIASGIAKESGMQPKLYDDKTVEGLSRYENFQELLNSIKEFVEADEVDTLGTKVEDKTLGSYLQQVSLLTDADDKKKSDKAVKLMTIHAAKGLEFPVVYLVGMEEELFPSKMSMGTREGLEEERRLFYVAATRAEKKFVMSYATTRFRFGKLIYCQPSRFIDEISPMNLEVIGGLTKPKPNTGGKFGNLFNKKKKRTAAKPARPTRPVSKLKDDPNFKAQDASALAEGMNVKHARFGEGTVMEIEGDAQNKIATISFGDMGEKRILIRFAKLQILS